MNIIKRGAAVIGAITVAANLAYAQSQNPFSFTSISVTDEGAIRFS
jgi:hypothetical protein